MKPSRRLRLFAVGYLAAAAFASAQAVSTQAPAGGVGEPIARFLVAPSPDGTRVSVEAVLRLEKNRPYLKDFDELESIRWTIEDKEIPAESERKGDILVFKGLPFFGEAKAAYTLRCVTEPRPGYRKRLMGGTGFLTAREGRLSTLAASSEAYDKPAEGGGGGGDMYALAPLFARKLDTEIRAFYPKAGLWLVFAAVSRIRDSAYDEFGRPKPIDLLALIREETGYDPVPLFKKYFSAPVKNAAELLR